MIGRNSIAAIAVVAVLIASGYIFILNTSDVDDGPETNPDPNTTPDPTTDPASDPSDLSVADTVWRSIVEITGLYSATLETDVGGGSDHDYIITVEGTGFIIAYGSSIAILTNAHVVTIFDDEVIEGSDGTVYHASDFEIVSLGFTCVFHLDGEERSAAYTLILYENYVDVEVDLAILFFEEGEVPDVSPLSFGSTDELTVSVAVFTIGNSEGNGLVLSTGYLGGSYAETGGKEVEVIWAEVTWITTNDDKDVDILALSVVIVIYHGNSGGPLMTEDGIVIGIISAGDMQDDGSSVLAFAVPVGTIQTFLEEHGA